MQPISVRAIVVLCMAALAWTALPSTAETKTFRLGVPPLKRELASVTIPSIELEQTTLREALEVLRVQIRKESADNSSPNFIIKDSNGHFARSNVTLQLEKIPADVLLQYIVNQVRGKIRYDKYAIVITPR